MQIYENGAIVAAAAATITETLSEDFSVIAQDMIPDADNTRSIGSTSKTWSELYLKAADGTDPAHTGQVFTCTSAQLAGLLGAGAKYLLLSKGP